MAGVPPLAPVPGPPAVPPPPVVGGAAPAPVGGPLYAAEPSVAERLAIIAAIDTNTHAIPPGWAAVAMTPVQAVAAIPQVVKDFASSSKRYLIGTTYSDVAAAFYKGLAIARQRNNPIQLIRDCILSVYVTYTLSTSWAPSYTAFAGASLFAQFDIAGRTAKAGGKDNWVTTSMMNSTAVHMLGYLLVASAPAGSLLARVKTERGTPFAVVPGDSEQQKIMAKAAESVNADDRALLQTFMAETPRLMTILSALFGAAGADVAVALAAANRFAGTAV